MQMPQCCSTASLTFIPISSHNRQLQLQFVLENQLCRRHRWIKVRSYGESVWKTPLKHATAIALMTWGVMLKKTDKDESVSILREQRKNLENGCSNRWRAMKEFLFFSLNSLVQILNQMERRTRASRAVLSINLKMHLIRAEVVAMQRVTIIETQVQRGDTQITVNTIRIADKLKTATTVAGAKMTDALISKSQAGNSTKQIMGILVQTTLTQVINAPKGILT